MEFLVDTPGPSVHIVHMPAQRLCVLLDCVATSPESIAPKGSSPPPQSSSTKGPWVASDPQMGGNLAQGFHLANLDNPDRGQSGEV